MERLAERQRETERETERDRGRERETERDRERERERDRELRGASVRDTSTLRQKDGGIVFNWHKSSQNSMMPHGRANGSCRIRPISMSHRKRPIFTSEFLRFRKMSEAEKSEGWKEWRGRERKARNTQGSQSRSTVTAVTPPRGKTDVKERKKTTLRGPPVTMVTALASLSKRGTLQHVRTAEITRVRFLGPSTRPSDAKHPLGRSDSRST